MRKYKMNLFEDVPPFLTALLPCESTTSKLRSYQDVLSEDETKDLHQAIELSLRESNRKQEKADTGPSYIDEDEALAKALQESLKLSGDSRTFAGCKRAAHFHHEVCNVCEELSSNCVKFPYWGQFICSEHRFDQTPRCFSCQRFKPSNVEYLDLGDGRKVCCNCYSTSVMDKSTCEMLWKEVHTFFRKLKLNVRDGIPCYLVDKNEMGKVRLSSHSTYSAAVGKTTNNIKMEIMTIDKFSLDGGKIEVAKKLSSRYHSISVLILFGYPRVVAGAIMAHEMMHAWMHKQGYDFELKVKECICQVIAHAWLDCFEDDDEGSSSSRVGSQTTSYVRNLKNFCKNQWEMAYSEAYGDAFRDAKFAVEKYGLKNTLNYVAKTRRLPQAQS